jgi:phosphoribosylformylglycinamidine cyclo-ligase
VPPIFQRIQEAGRVADAEMLRTFNMGVGMVAVLPSDEVDRALAVLTGRHVPAWILGTVRRGDADVMLRGRHAA